MSGDNAYRFLKNPINSFHLEITTKCTLSCPRCPRTIYKGKYPVEDLPLDLIQKRFTSDVLKPVKYVLFCGDHGDPIYHSKFHEVIGHFKSHGKKLTINTNASRRDSEWWEKTASILDPKDDIKFSIDGLEDTNHLYRVNSRWKDIMAAVEACRGRTRMIWKFIVFKHNQHQIYQAEKLAEKLGFDQFLIVRSHLFGSSWLKDGEKEDPLMPDEQWLDPKYFSTEKKKNHWLENIYSRFRSYESFKKMRPFVDRIKPDPRSTVDKRKFRGMHIFPKCKFGTVHYVNAHGLYLPCCWAGNYDLYKNSILEDYEEKYDLRKHSFADIQSSIGLKKLEESWSEIDKAPRVCRTHCSAKSPPKGWSESYDEQRREL